jgi:hypothetical protein
VGEFIIHLLEHAGIKWLVERLVPWLVPLASKKLIMGLRAWEVLLILSILLSLIFSAKAIRRRCKGTHRRS